MTDPQLGRLTRFRVWVTSYREMDSYKDFRESDTKLKASIADFKAFAPPWVLTRQMLYLAVVMFLCLGTFRLIGAVMLLVGSRWLANWFMARSPNSRGLVRGDTNRA